jgi:predicted ATPase with chaperone activity
VYESESIASAHPSTHTQVAYPSVTLAHIGIHNITHCVQAGSGKTTVFSRL